MMLFSSWRKYSWLATAALWLSQLSVSAQNPYDNLKNWTQVHPSPAQRLAYQLCAPNDSVLFAVGALSDGNDLLRTTDRGLTWQIMSRTLQRASSAGIYYDHRQWTFFDAQQGVVTYDSTAALPASQRGQVRSTTDGGATWSAPRPAPYGLTKFFTPSEGMVIQSQQRVWMVYHTTNGGQTWTLLDSLAGLYSATRLDDYSVNITSPQTAYTFQGGDPSATPPIPPQLVRLNLGQHTWQPVATQPALTDPTDLFSEVKFITDSLGCMIFLSSANGFAYAHRLYVTGNGGRTWQLAPNYGTLGFANGQLNTPAMADTQHMLMHDPIMGEGPKATSDNWQTFSYMQMPELTPPPAGPPGPGGQGFGFPDFNNGSTSAQFLLRPSGVGWAMSPHGLLCYTSDFGATWALRSTVLTESGPYAMGFPDPMHGWASLYLDNALLRTTDNGTSWTRVALPPDASHPTAAAFPDADSLFVAISTSANLTVLHQSTDAGQTWSQPALPFPTNRPLAQIQFHDGARRGIAVGAAGTLIRTIDGGQTWTAPASGTTDDLRTVAWLDDQTLLAGGGHSLLKSTDGGATWQSFPTPPPISANGYLSQLAFPTPQLGFAITGNQTQNTLYRTTDGGQTWNNTGVDTLGVLLVFFSPAEGWAGSYHTLDSGRTWMSTTILGGIVPIDPNNMFGTYAIGSVRGTITRYSKQFVRPAPLPVTTFAMGDQLRVAFSTEGDFAPADRDFRIELSNEKGRFRRGQTRTIGRGTSSPISAQLPIALPPGSAYRIRVVRADSTLLGADTGQNLTIQHPTGLAEPDPAHATRLQLYPNPAQQRVTVAFGGAQPGRTVRLLDVLGRTVLLAPAASATTDVSLLHIAPGSYWLQARTADGHTTAQRLIVQP
jgi:photosystem II stability/assembly factor-like uncharacterized protein